MAIKSEIYRGKIYAGSTPLSSDLVVEQTGPLELTVRAGTLVSTSGMTHQVVETKLAAVPGEQLVFTVGTAWVVLPTEVPADCTDLSQIDIYVLETQQGFPAGYVPGLLQPGTPA